MAVKQEPPEADDAGGGGSVAVKQEQHGLDVDDEANFAELMKWAFGDAGSSGSAAADGGGAAGNTCDPSAVNGMGCMADVRGIAPLLQACVLVIGQCLSGSISPLTTASYSSPRRRGQPYRDCPITWTPQRCQATARLAPRRLGPTPGSTPQLARSASAKLARCEVYSNPYTTPTLTAYASSMGL